MVLIATLSIPELQVSACSLLHRDFLNKFDIDYRSRCNCQNSSAHITSWSMISDRSVIRIMILATRAVLFAAHHRRTDIFIQLALLGFAWAGMYTQ